MRLSGEVALFAQLRVIRRCSGEVFPPRPGYITAESLPFRHKDAQQQLPPAIDLNFCSAPAEWGMGNVHLLVEKTVDKNVGVGS
jgi:hypothetical protein